MRKEEGKAGQDNTVEGGGRGHELRYRGGVLAMGQAFKINGRG